MEEIGNSISYYIRINCLFLFAIWIQYARLFKQYPLYLHSRKEGGDEFLMAVKCTNADISSFKYLS